MLNWNQQNDIKSIAHKANIDLDNDIKINDPNLYYELLNSGSLALGEGYMNNKWESKDITIDQLFYKIGKAKLSNIFTWKDKLKIIPSIIISWLYNYQNQDTSKEVALKHYDLGNEIYQYMLDSRMIYSCGYWKYADSIEDAQRDKLDLICRKLKLQPDMTVLDIGCGWGGLAQYMTENYHVKVVGITISKEQLIYANNNNKYPADVRYELLDYRELVKHYNKEFDAIVSVGMFEHVGSQNYTTFMNIINQIMKDDGLCLLHTIGGNKARLIGDPWITKYIFPNSVLPTLNQIIVAADGLLMTEDVHNFGPDYDKTLMAWYDNFKSNFDNINKERLKNNKEPLDNKFYKMWEYYLLSSAGLFRSRQVQLYQVVFSKGINRYISVR